MTWRELSKISVEARLQLHWAAQILTAAADVALELAADDSHSNLGWDERIGALIGRAHVGLRLADLTLVFDDRDDELALEGRNIAEAFEWVTIHGSVAQPMTLRDYEMPAHPVADGAAFAAIDATEYDAIARWYHAAHDVFEDIERGHPGASEPRCWPHHFDIATLITIDAAADPHEATSIGVGMSPGDSSYEQPYWYVNPWPRPKDQPLPALAAGGHWHTAGWFGAVLSHPSPADDVRAFLVSAMAHARTLIGGE